MPTINFSGLASGIDSTALIKATSDAARSTREKPLQTKITEIQDETDALKELKTKLTTLRDKIEVFSTLNGGGLAKQASSTDETVLTGSAANSATNGSYSVTVTTKAKNATASLKSLSQTYSSSSAVINSSINNGAASANRTVTVNVGTGSNLETINVVLTSSTTLDSFVTSYNASATKSVASVVNVGTTSSPDYRVAFVTNNEGTERGQISISVGSEITTAGSGAWNDNPTPDQATDATFTISGLGGTITRATNKVTDVIPGVTFELVAAGTSVLTVSDDKNTSTSRVQEFVDAYNEIVKYIADSNTVTRDESGSEVKNVFAALANSRVDDNSLSALRSAISSSVYSSGSTVKIFADLGITTERDGSLKFDTTVFQTAIDNEATSVNRVLTTFADTTSVTGGTIDQYTRFNGLLDLSINGNDQQITDLNKRISEAEASILKQEDDMRARFARLESSISRLQNQQSQLSSALAGLGR